MEGLAAAKRKIDRVDDADAISFKVFETSIPQ